MEQFVDVYRRRTVKVTYILVIFLGLLSEYNSLFVFETAFQLISYHTLNLGGISIAIFGWLLLQKKRYYASSFLLITLILVGTIAGVKLTHIQPTLSAEITSILALGITIIFSTFILGKKIAFPITGITIVLYVTVSFLGTPPPDEIHNISHYMTVSILLLVVATIQYLTHKRLDKQTIALEASNYELTKKTRIIKHEIKQPLQGLQLILHTINESETHRPDLIQKAIDALSLINSVVGQDDKPHSELKSNVEMTNISEIFDYHISTFHTDKDIKLIPSITHDNMYIHVSKTDMMQICQNLLSNAERFTPTGGEIIFSMGIALEFFIISTSDNGVGITEEQRLTIFDMYQKGIESEGQGIGLSLVKDIAESYSGTIELASNENSGTTFFILIPLSQKIVLYFEDDELARDAMHLVFEQLAGYTLHTFENTRTWQEEIEKYQPDIIFLDIDIPPVGGDQVNLQAKEMFPDIIYIAHTANATADDRKFYLENFAFDGFIGKPSTPQIIRSHLAKVEEKQSLI